MATRAIIWITDIDSNGEVFQRQHAVTVWPVTVGRAIDNDIVLLDPHVAAHHLHLNYVDTQVTARVLQTVNGIVLSNRAVPSIESAPMTHTVAALQSANWQCSERLTLGRSSLRYIDEATQLAPELVFEQAAQDSLKSLDSLKSQDSLAKPKPDLKPSTLSVPDLSSFNWQSVLGIFFLLMSITTAEAFITNNPDTYVIAAFKAAGLVLAAIAVWALLWAILSKVFSGRLHYFEHALLAAKYIIVTSLVLWHLDMLSFAFSIEWLGQFDAMITILAGAWLISKHLKIALNASDPNHSGRRTARIITVVTMLLGLSVAGLIMGQRYQSTGRFNEGLYMSTFMPPSWRLHKAQPPQSMVDGLAGIKAKADALAQTGDDKGADDDSEE